MSVGVEETDGGATAWRSLFYSLAVLGASLLPVPLGLSGHGYIWVALFLGLSLVGTSVLFLRQRGQRQARWLFVASVIYLPVLVGTLVAQRLFHFLSSSV